MSDLAQLSKVCSEGLEAIGYELVDLEYLRDPGGWVLRVYIDAPSSGEQETTAAAGPAPVPRSTITHQDCKAASNHLGTVLDVEDIIDNAYRLEVSSPGVMRPVRKEKDFNRFAGHKAKVVMQEAIDGRKKYTGVIKGAGEGRVQLELDSGLVELPLDRMKRARLEVEL